MTGKKRTYVIDPTTALISLQSTNEDTENRWVIRRRSGAEGNTSAATVEEIRDPDRLDPLRRAALQQLRLDAVAYQGLFPSRYFVRFSRAVIETAIRYYGPDDGVSRAGTGFGVEVSSSRSRAVYHVYEAIVPRHAGDEYRNWDKVQHFIRSAALEYELGALVTDVAQYGKELILDELWSAVSGGSDGFSSADMEANNLGQVLGAVLARRYHPTLPHLGVIEPLRRAPRRALRRAQREAESILLEAERALLHEVGYPGY